MRRVYRRAGRVARRKFFWRFVLAYVARPGYPPATPPYPHIPPGRVTGYLGRLRQEGTHHVPGKVRIDVYPQPGLEAGSAPRAAGGTTGGPPGTRACLG